MRGRGDRVSQSLDAVCAKRPTLSYEPGQQLVIRENRTRIARPRCMRVGGNEVANKQMALTIAERRAAHLSAARDDRLRRISGVQTIAHACVGHDGVVIRRRAHRPI